MLATRWEPRGVWSELSQLRDHMDHLFNGNGLHHRGTAAYPALNLWEDNDTLFVEAELPGFDMSDLEILATGNNQLLIKGERKQPALEEGTWHRQERGYGSFTRMIELPEPVDPDKVTADFKNGILTISMPRKEEVKSRKIQVNAV